MICLYCSTSPSFALANEKAVFIPIDSCEWRLDPASITVVKRRPTLVDRGCEMTS